MKEKTFFVFKSSGEISTSLFGPMYREDVETVVTEHYEKYEEYEVVEEEVFKLMYPKQYSENFKTYWCDHLELFLKSLPYDLGIEVTESEEEGTEGEYVIESDLLFLMLVNGKLFLSLNINLDPTLSSIITLGLTNYVDGIIPIEINSPFYYSAIEDEYYYDKEAYTKSIAESTVIILN